MGLTRHIAFSLFPSTQESGFSDKYIGTLTGVTESLVRVLRRSLGIVPLARQMDTCAGEYPAQVDSLYLTFAGQEHDVGFGTPGYTHPHPPTPTPTHTNPFAGTPARGR